MIETRSKNSMISQGEIELLKSNHEIEIKKMTDAMERESHRGVLLFIYAVSLLATFAWKYVSPKDVMPLLQSTKADKLLLSINPNLASYNLLDLSIAVAAYHYFIFQTIRYRYYVTCASLLVLMTIGSVPFLM